MSPVTIVSGKDIPSNPNPVEHFTFADLVAFRSHEFPLLAHAAAASKPAHSPKVEWLPRAAVAGTTVETWWNWTQIVRFPYEEPAEEGSVFRGGHKSRDEALKEFLAAVDLILWDGQRDEWLSQSGMPKRACGGVRYFLGRDPVIGDRVALRPLREPRFYAWTHDYNEDTGEWVERENAPIYEWLAEFSLQVSPA